MDSVTLSRFDGHDTLPEHVIVCVGGVYELFCHQIGVSRGAGAKTSTSPVDLVCVVPYFGGQGSLGCHQWKDSRVSS